MEMTYHVPVLKDESIGSLNINPDGCYVDLTFGGGGHSRAILEKLSPKGKLYAFDQDSDTFENIPDDKRITFIHSNFRFMRAQLRALGVEALDGVFADLGVSSHHFDEASRGFSFRYDALLDMRMNRSAMRSAKEIIETYSHGDLLKIFRDYGELKMPHKVASAVVYAREESPITTTGDLISAVERCTPKWEESKFLAKLFQAIRIEVNLEMESLKMMLEQSVKVLKNEGVLSIITYHSLEDRLVKNYMKSGNFEGKIEKDIYGRSSFVLDPLKKIILPSEEEIELNPRARSAKLRVAVKCGL